MTPEQVYWLVYLSLSLLVLIGNLVLPKLLAKLTPAQHEVVQEFAAMVVPAVEQTVSMMSGESKRQEAMRIITELTKAVGVKPNPTLISTAIEAAVYAMNEKRANNTTVMRPIIQIPPASIQNAPSISAQPTQPNIPTPK